MIQKKIYIRKRKSKNQINKKNKNNYLKNKLSMHKSTIQKRRISSNSKKRKNITKKLSSSSKNFFKKRASNNWRKYLS